MSTAFSHSKSHCNPRWGVDRAPVDVRDPLVLTRSRFLAAPDGRDHVETDALTFKHCVQSPYYALCDNGDAYKLTNATTRAVSTRQH